MNWLEWRWRTIHSEAPKVLTSFGKTLMLINGEKNLKTILKLFWRTIQSETPKILIIFGKPWCSMNRKKIMKVEVLKLFLRRRIDSSGCRWLFIQIDTNHSWKHSLIIWLTKGAGWILWILLVVNTFYLSQSHSWKHSLIIWLTRGAGWILWNLRLLLVVNTFYF